MKITIVNLMLSSLLFFSASVFSREFNDLKFPDTVILSGTETQLQLNGVGMRTKFVFDVYIGALYTEKPAKTRDEVLAQTGANRVLMHFVYDEVSAEKLVAGWNEGFEENQSEKKLKVLSERIKKFNAMFQTVHEGDIVLLDYIPGKGTVVTIKDKEQGVIEGEDFNKALLDIWLGEEPADDDLKEAMLGGE
jgi:hypothetical protein